MRLIDESVLKEWIENWFTKNRFYHPYAKNNNIPITELYDILEQMPTAHENLQPTCNQLATDCISRQAAIDEITDANIVENMDSVFDTELHRVKRQEGEEDETD